MQEIQEMLVWSLGREDPLQDSMATHSSISACRIPWTEEPARLQPTGSQTVRHELNDLEHTRPRENPPGGSNEYLNKIPKEYLRRWPLYIYVIFPGGSICKETAYNAGYLSSIPGSGRSPGEGNGNTLQYSSLENPRDRGSWWASAHGVTKNRTQLSNWRTTLYLYVICHDTLAGTIQPAKLCKV